MSKKTMSRYCPFKRDLYAYCFILVQNWSNFCLILVLSNTAAVCGATAEQQQRQQQEPQQQGAQYQIHAGQDGILQVYTLNTFWT
jgi:hypothetical protein